MDAKAALKKFDAENPEAEMVQGGDFPPVLKITHNQQEGLFLDGIFVSSRQVKKLQGEGTQSVLRFRVNATNAPAFKSQGKGKDPLPVEVIPGTVVDVYAPTNLDRSYTQKAPAAGTPIFIEYHGKKKTNKGNMAHIFTAKFGKIAAPVAAGEAGSEEEEI
jgi:hypothetical protein